MVRPSIKRNAIRARNRKYDNKYCVVCGKENDIYPKKLCTNCILKYRHRYQENKDKKLKWKVQNEERIITPGKN